MSGRRRRELADSFRLVIGDEQWFLRDLLVGVVAAVIWVGATGALAIQVADVVGVSLRIAPGVTPHRSQSPSSASSGSSSRPSPSRSGSGSER